MWSLINVRHTFRVKKELRVLFAEGPSHLSEGILTIAVNITRNIIRGVSLQLSLKNIARSIELKGKCF